MDEPKRGRLSPVVVGVLLALVGWWIWQRGDRPLPGVEATPRAVTPQGELAADERNTIEIFQAASPSVVYITTIGLRRGLFSLNVYEIPQGTGSGFVWDPSGHIITNYHVLADANRVEITLADHSVWKGSFVGAAPDKDIAVLRIAAPAAQLRPIPVGESRSLLVGQKVFAIGNPFGLDQTITSGIVSALGREIQSSTGRTIQDVIQTDAAINPGNSGGPLLDSSGRLIGVNTAIYSPSGSSAGIGFAVPVDVVNRVVPEIITHGRVAQPGLGVSIANDKVAQRLGVTGVLIMAVQPRSAAEAAGLRGTERQGADIALGDIITAVNGREVTTYDDLRNELDRYRVGDEVTLAVTRGEARIEVRVRLEEVE
ncbi:MAG: trypsin-like peptidase domain-containing protein [Thermodesulfobacteriota bacterium]